MHVVKVISRRQNQEYVSYLLRQSYREGNQVKKRTIANLSALPEHIIDAIRRGLAGDPLLPGGGSFAIEQSWPHGHVAAVLGTAQRLGLDRIIDAQASRQRELVLAMIAQRVIDPCSKLACAQALSVETQCSTLGEVLGVSRADEDDRSTAMDWLVSRQQPIEGALAGRHLSEGTLVLYAVSSAALEGRHCELAHIGYARDGVKGRLQIVYGLLTSKEGCPVAVEVFEGNTADPATVPAQVAKLRERFGLSRVVLVGDRGMITEARIDQDQKSAGLEWITALRAPAIRKLAEAGTIQHSLFDQSNLAEVSHPDYPGERLVACRNPILAAERRRRREALLAATEAELATIEGATKRDTRRLHGKERIGVRVGKVINRYKVAKHFLIEIGDEYFSFRRNEPRIAQEAALDGIYVIRTNVADDGLSSPEVVASYKRLQRVERAFRVPSGDLEVRPIHHRKGDRVRAHLLICMLAHYVEWHMRERLAPLLFSEEDPEQAAAGPDPVTPSGRSPSSAAKARTKRTQDGLPVQSFPSLLRNLATIAANRIQPTEGGIPPFDTITTPTALQERALGLLGVSERLGFSRAAGSHRTAR